MPCMIWTDLFVNVKGFVPDTTLLHQDNRSYNQSDVNGNKFSVHMAIYLKIKLFYKGPDVSNLD